MTNPWNFLSTLLTALARSATNTSAFVRWICLVESWSDVENTRENIASQSPDAWRVSLKRKLVLTRPSRTELSTKKMTLYKSRAIGPEIAQKCEANPFASHSTVINLPSQLTAFQPIPILTLSLKTLTRRDFQESMSSLTNSWICQKNDGCAKFCPIKFWFLLKFSRLYQRGA